MGMIVPQSAGSRPLGAALTFVAIDFETADHGPDSACAVGLVRVSGAEIVKRKYYLIRPPRNSFFFTPVHGITWEHVQRKPTFEALWPKLQNFLLAAEFIASHSVGFDRRILKSCCRAAKIPPPAIPYVCTVKSRAAGLGYPPYQSVERLQIPRTTTKPPCGPLRRRGMCRDRHCCQPVWS